MAFRSRDLSRFKKLYSYSPQPPVNVTLSVLEQNYVVDAARFRKTYLSSRVATTLANIVQPASGEWSPSNAGNALKLWLRADTGITIATGVGTWEDASGYSRVFSQATGVQQPALTSADPDYNNQPVLLFTGTETLPSTTFGSSITGTRTLMFVCDAQSSTGVLSSLFDTYLLWSTGGNVAEWYSPNTVTALSSISSPSAILVVDDGINTVIYVDDFVTPSASVIGTIPNMTIDMVVGGGTYGGVPSQQGRTAEIAIWAGALTEEERIKARAYVAERYGI